MAIKKYRPLSPDPYVNKIKGDTEFARLAHLNDLVNQVQTAIDAIDAEVPPQAGHAGEFLSTDGTNTSWQTIYATAASGLPVEFSSQKIYGSATSPLSTNITANLTGANLGVVQKIYHQSGVAPTFPSGWVQLGTTTYTTGTLNIIYVEWAGGTRVEYWITQ